jgi:hypothetical protein
MSGSAEVIRNMYSWAVMKQAGCTASGFTAGGNMQNYARTHKRWNDITGNARAGLNGGSYWETMNILKIYIAHSMSYGVYLELSNDRKFAILEETVNKYKDSFYNAVKKIMES